MEIEERKEILSDLICGVIFYFIVYICYIVSYFRDEVSIQLFFYSISWFLLFCLVIDIFKTKKALSE